MNIITLRDILIEIEEKNFTMTQQEFDLLLKAPYTDSDWSMVSWEPILTVTPTPEVLVA
jgi:hypothetical protein